MAYVCAHMRPDSVQDSWCRQGFHPNACNLAQLNLPIYLFKDDDKPAGL